MNTIGDAFLKAFNPLTAIRITSLEDKSIVCLLHEIHDVVKERYETVLDTAEDVIYLGRKK